MQPTCGMQTYVPLYAQAKLLKGHNNHSVAIMSDSSFVIYAIQQHSFLSFYLLLAIWNGSIQNLKQISCKSGGSNNLVYSPYHRYILEVHRAHPSLPT